MKFIPTTMKQILVLFAFLLIQTFTIVSCASAQWVLQPNEPANTEIESLAVIGTNLFTGGAGGVFRSTDSGASWIATNNGLAYTINGFSSSDVQVLEVIGANSPSPMLFAGTGGGVFRSTDNGANWTAMNNGLTHKDVSCFAVSNPNSSSPTLFAGTLTNEIYRSSNNGASWIMVDSIAYSGNNDFGAALCVSGTNVYFGSGQGISWSPDNGANWTVENIGLFDPPLSTSVSALAVSGSTLVVSNDGNSVFRSTNNGTNWTVSSNGLTKVLNEDALTVIGSDLLIAAEGGIFLSTDGGLNWKSVNEGFGIDSMDNFEAFAMNDTFLYVADFGYGVWRRPLSEMIAPSSAVQSPEVTLTTAQVYPNPFPAKTTVTISPSESSMVTIIIVNLLGQEVAHLFDGKLTAGEHSFTWDARGVAPGSYWCIARVGNKSERIALSVQR